MAYLFEVERVKYKCSCGSRFPLCRLYFCRYCVALRCADCTQHEADVYFCPQCLQSHMAPEAKLYHMRCKTCFECPSCSCHMALRAVAGTGDSSASPSPSSSTTGDKSSAAVKKSYYLACGYCHWTTRDGGFKDQDLASLHESFFDSDPAMFKQLKESYQLISMRDASEKSLRKNPIQGPRRKNYASLALKDDTLQPTFAAKLSQLTAGLSSLNRNRQLASVSADQILQGVKSIATDSIDPLPQSFLDDEVSLAQVASLSQRLRDVSVQPQTMSGFRPIRKRLAIKKSVRCKTCDHSLCKPEFSTSNIKFKIQLLAQLQIPEVRISPGYDLKPNQTCDLVLSVSNPDQLSPCNFSLLPDNSNPMRTCDITTPGDEEFTLEPKNEAFSLDDSVEVAPDKEMWLLFNHGSKIGLKCKVDVPEELDGDAIVCVVLRFTPTSSSGDGEPGVVDFPVAINLS